MVCIAYMKLCQYDHVYCDRFFTTGDYNNLGGMETILKLINGENISSKDWAYEYKSGLLSKYIFHRNDW